jgi:hypothetical protein
MVRTDEKRGKFVGKTKCGKGQKVVDLVDERGTPLAIKVSAANHHDVKLI